GAGSLLCHRSTRDPAGAEHRDSVHRPEHPDDQRLGPYAGDGRHRPQEHPGCIDGDLTMPGPILHVGATVLCAHGGQAVPTVPSPRVLVSGMPAATIGAPYAVAGCPFVPPGGNGPCVTGQWVVGAIRVVSLGQPLAIMTGVAICAPTGT